MKPGANTQHLSRIKGPSPLGAGPAWRPIEFNKIVSDTNIKYFPFPVTHYAQITYRSAAHRRRP